MTTENGAELELGDIQVGALMPRPHPYAGAYLALRIDDRHDGRELLRRLIPLLEPAEKFASHCLSTAQVSCLTSVVTNTTYVLAATEAGTWVSASRMSAIVSGQMSGHCV